MSADLLIVFTDEVGSTARDCLAQGPSDILDPRTALFAVQLCHMRGDGWKVLKNVGDALVIKYEGNASSIADAVHSIFLAWKERLTAPQGKLRVAIHRPATDGLAPGTALRMALSQGGLQTLPSLWPSFHLLDDDLFGLEMNLAARLASLPTGNAFVISENVLADPNDETRQRLACLLQPDYYISPSIPVTHLKGFEDYLLFDGLPMNKHGQYGNRRTFWVCEVLPKTPAAAHSSLIADSRRFQVIRTIRARYQVHDTKSNQLPRRAPFLRYAIRAAERCVRSLLGDGSRSAFGYHADVLFRLGETWLGKPARVDRSAPQSTHKWLKRSQRGDTEQEFAEFPPTHVLFSSTFDDDVDRLLGYRLKKEKLEDFPAEDIPDDIKVTGELSFESQSIFERARWAPDAFNQQSEAYYLLVLQVKNSAPYPPDDWRNFGGVDQAVAGLRPLGWGLLRGTADGYVLYGASSVHGGDTARIGQLDGQCRQDPNKRSFLSRIIPLWVHKLEFVWRQDVRQLWDLNKSGPDLEVQDVYRAGEMAEVSKNQDSAKGGATV